MAACFFDNARHLTFAVGLDPAPRAYLAPTKKGAAFGQRFDVIEPASVPGSYLRFYLVDTDRIAPEGLGVHT